jgi:hypothetical protein
MNTPEAINFGVSTYREMLRRGHTLSYSNRYVWDRLVEETGSERTADIVIAVARVRTLRDK